MSISDVMTFVVIAIMFCAPVLLLAALAVGGALLISGRRQRRGLETHAAEVKKATADGLHVEQSYRDHLNRLHQRASSTARKGWFVLGAAAAVVVLGVVAAVLFRYPLQATLSAQPVPERGAATNGSKDIDEMGDRLAAALDNDKQEDLDALACTVEDVEMPDAAFDRKTYPIGAMGDTSVEVVPRPDSTYDLHYVSTVSIAGYDFTATGQFGTKRDTSGTFCIYDVGLTVATAFSGVRDSADVTAVDGVPVSADTCGATQQGLLRTVSQHWRVHEDLKRREGPSALIGSGAPAVDLAGLGYCTPGNQEEVFAGFEGRESTQALDALPPYGGLKVGPTADGVTAFYSVPSFPPAPSLDMSPAQVEEYLDIKMWRLEGTMAEDPDRPGHFVVRSIDFGQVKQDSDR